MLKNALVLLGILVLFGAGAARAAEHMPVEIRGASVAIDERASLPVSAAAQLHYTEASRFLYPGLASVFRPLVVWVRFLPQRSNPPGYLVAAPGVGRADLYFFPPHSQRYTVERFGMRVPFSQRSVARVRPSLEIPLSANGAPMYLRLALDDESRLVPMITLQSRATVSQEDAATDRLAATALFFIGIFVSLAFANLFVFVFVREMPYMLYSGMMLSNALFAATYMHESAWKWIWPGASFPDAATQATIVILNALFLLAFARSFLNTPRLIPRTDRILVTLALALVVVGWTVGFIAPSTHFTPAITGREVFILAVMAFVADVFILGLCALRAGSMSARFFVASNFVVSATVSITAVSNLWRHDITGNTDFIGVLSGQSAEGWLLFGALAFRLRQAVRAHIDEQGRRLVAQAEALAQARALLEHRQLASTDALTGVANRRAFDEALSREWDRCARAGAPLSLLMIDVDHFKRFNDSYGHVKGDDCLRRIAGAIAGCATRPTDFTARYGGEEFVVILPETGGPGAELIAGQIVAAARALGIPHRGSSLGTVSISAGVATSMPVPGAPVAIVEAADANLYRAKHGGRNRYASNATLEEQALRAEPAEVGEMLR